ncbi:MAG: ATP-binding protein [Acidobacteriota bacterium]
MPHIFERFYRSANVSRTNIKGTGIGLAMAEVIARLHNAKITVESQPQAGTRFIIKFPRLPTASSLNEQPVKKAH